jgi:hypothetical protein
MGGERHPPVVRDCRNRADGSDTAVTLWIVAAFLGGLVTSHYVLRSVLNAGASDVPSATLTGGFPL